MKKVVLIFSMTFLLLSVVFNKAIAQEQPKSKKDTVNMDTDAKPTFYYATEDEKPAEKSSGTTIAVIAGAVVIVGAAGFFLLKKKK